MEASAGESIQSPVLAISMTRALAASRWARTRIVIAPRWLARPYEGVFDERKQEQRRDALGGDGGGDVEFDGEKVAPAGLFDVEVGAEEFNFVAEGAVVGVGGLEEGELTEVGEAFDGGARAHEGWGELRADGGEGVKEEVGVGLVAEHFEARFFLGEAGGGFFVEFEAVEAGEFAVVGEDGALFKEIFPLRAIQQPAGEARDENGAGKIDDAGRHEIFRTGPAEQDHEKRGVIDREQAGKDGG